MVNNATTPHMASRRSTNEYAAADTMTGAVIRLNGLLEDEPFKREAECIL